jgi:hypothetical protein
VDDFSVIPESLPEGRTIFDRPFIEVVIGSEIVSVAVIYVPHKMIDVGILDSRFRRLPEKFTHDCPLLRLIGRRGASTDTGYKVTPTNTSYSTTSSVLHGIIA